MVEGFGELLPEPVERPDRQDLVAVGHRLDHEVGAPRLGSHDESGDVGQQTAQTVLDPRVVEDRPTSHHEEVLGARLGYARLVVKEG